MHYRQNNWYKKLRFRFEDDNVYPWGVFQEDRSVLQKPDLSPHSRVAVKLRLAEKEILERAEASGRAKRLHFQKQQDDGAPLPVYEESDIALLENADAKLPIVLHQLEEEEEDEELKMPLLNSERKKNESGGEKVEPSPQRTENTCEDQE